MNRLQVELVPAIGGRLIELGLATVLGGAHGLRRMAEGFVWSEPPSRCHTHGHCGCAQVHHHYRHHCQPRCYDCRR